jgi:hypothetical protein
MLHRITDRVELVALVQRIMAARDTDDVLHDLIDLLERSTACPEVSDYIFHSKPSMTAAEVIAAALAHHPFNLGDGS